jgi:hypothetical protein
LESTAAWAGAGILLAQAQEEPRRQIDRLDPATKAKALAALTGLVILMFGLMFLASLGARWARNYGRRTKLSFERRPQPSWDRDDWASKPLRPADVDETDSGAPS